MADNTLGVVVVGVGIAGRVRIRDLRQCHQFDETKGATLIGYVSRRELEIEGATQITLDDALTRPDVHVIIVCTENERHEDLTRRSVEAGKHVLVEFPLALSTSAARQLYALADKNNVIVYEEDISLLTDSFKSLRAVIKDKPRVTEGLSTLQGKFNGWVENLDKSGSPFHSSISQLHRLVALFDDIAPVEASISRSDKFTHTHAKLKTKDDGVITLAIDREHVDCKRQVTFQYKFDDGTHIDHTSLPVHSTGGATAQPGLFMKDFMQFLQVLENKMPRDELKRVTLTALELADQLYEMAKANPNSQL